MPDAPTLRRVPPAAMQSRRVSDGLPAANRTGPRGRPDPAAEAFARYLAAPPGSAAAARRLAEYSALRFAPPDPVDPGRRPR